MEKTAVILVNLGTPEQPTKPKVRDFLSEFLNDPLVIDLPYIARKILVNLIIIPFRAGKSTKMYQKIWTEEGSPIMVHMRTLFDRLKQKPNKALDYYFAMRYGRPSLAEVLKKINTNGYEKLFIIPMFPQYADSTTGSVIEKSKEVLKQINYRGNVNFQTEFYRHKAFIQTWKSKLKSIEYQKFEHILFVFHGLPVRQTERKHTGHSCSEMRCKTQIYESNRQCYFAQCQDNSRILAAELGIEKSKYTVCFQSRFGKKWLEPFADKIIEEKAKQGIKSLLVVPLSFVADCLETKLEIEIEYTDLFMENGGEKFVMAESLNSCDDWVGALSQIIADNKV